MSRLRLVVALIVAVIGMAMSLPGGVAASTSTHAKNKHCVKYKK